MSPAFNGTDIRLTPARTLIVDVSADKTQVFPSCLYPELHFHVHAGGAVGVSRYPHDFAEPDVNVPEPIAVPVVVVGADPPHAFETQVPLSK